MPGCWTGRSDAGTCLRAGPVELSDLALLAPTARHWVEHPRLDFVSYPYEWTFSALQRAALLHLDFQVELLADDFTMSDATAYNVQFRGTKPVFIDHLSIIPYEEGSAWAGQRQFGMQFLNPLFLWAKRGIAPHAWFRGSVEGVAPEDIIKLLRWRDRLSFTVLAHIVGPAMVARRRVAEGLDAKPPREAKLSKARLVAMLQSLRDYIAGLSMPGEGSVARLLFSSRHAWDWTGPWGGALFCRPPIRQGRIHRRRLVRCRLPDSQYSLGSWRTSPQPKLQLH